MNNGLATLADALRWLRDHVDELEAPPLRLHGATVGDADATGAPRFTPEFWALLTSTPYRTRWAQETVVCPLPHPLDAKKPCPMCSGQLSWTSSREVYVHPLAAALERLSHVPASAPTLPSPFVLCVALLDCGMDIDRTHQRLWDHPISSEDRRKTVEALFLSAIRRLQGRWSSGPIPKRGQISEAQSQAEAAA